MSSSKKDKMSKQEEDVDDDDILAKTANAYENGILSIELDPYRKQATKKQPADKKKQQKIVRPFERDDNTRQKSISKGSDRTIQIHRQKNPERRRTKNQIYS